MHGMELVGLGEMRVVGSSFMSVRIVVRGGFLVVPCCLFVMFGRLAMMVGRLFRHGLLAPSRLSTAHRW
jgi:hypothetical protein